MTNISKPRSNAMPSPHHLLLLVFAICIVGLAHAQSTATRAERPEVKVGDRWRWETKDRRTGIKQSEIDRRLTSVTASQIEGIENGDKLVLSADLNVIDSPAVVPVGDARYLNFPLEIGKKWEFKYSFTNKLNSTKTRWQLEANVIAYERVKVPAGEFDTFKIEYEGYWNNDTTGRNGSLKLTNWYAPAARGVVKIEYEDGHNYSTRELMEFQLQP